MPDQDLEARREAWLQKIRSNIDSYGHHVTSVQQGTTPRFAYTIGLSPRAGEEIVLAGAADLLFRDVMRVINRAGDLAHGPGLNIGDTLEVEHFGAFSVAPVDNSWVQLLLLGAVDFYGDTVSAVQLLPDPTTRTIDVPDLSRPFDPAAEPVWAWMTEPWSFAVPAGSHAVTNLDALRGKPITEACRWEDDTWEIFHGAGPDVAHEDARVVPLGTLLGFDPSLRPVVDLEVGSGIRRSPPGPWHPWRRRGKSD